MFPDEMSRFAPPDRVLVVGHLKQLAAELGRRPLFAELSERCGIPQRQLRRCYGSYRVLLGIGGLPAARMPRRFDDETLLRALRDAFLAAGGLISPSAFRRSGGPTASAVMRRWKGWNGALVMLRDWLTRVEPDYAYLDVLRYHCQRNANADSTPAPACGELLRFRALDHAPTAEPGVVFLFGLVAEELGFVLEVVRVRFPDALGRRRVGKEWRRVRIEFEHRSANFQLHGHDPAGCDLIVCWEHDWPDCPLEVLELRSAIKDLKRGAVLARLP